MKKVNNNKIREELEELKEEIEGIKRKNNP